MGEAPTLHPGEQDFIWLYGGCKLLSGPLIVATWIRKLYRLSKPVANPRQLPEGVMQG